MVHIPRLIVAGVVKTYNLPLSDDNGQATSQLSAATLIISVCVQDYGDDLATILKQASDALDRVKGPKMLRLSEGASTTESAAASVGSVLEKIGKVAEVMDSLAEVGSHVAVKRTSLLIGDVDSFLCEGSLGHPRSHSEGTFALTLIP